MSQRLGSPGTPVLGVSGPAAGCTAGSELAEPTSELEARPKVKLQAARRQLAGGLAERTVGHARVNAIQVGAVKQVEDFALGFDFDLLRKEPRKAEVLLEGEVHVLVSRPVVGVAAEITFLTKSRRRELRRREDSVQEFGLRLAAQVRAKGRHVG